MSRSIKAPSTPDDRGLEPIWATLEAGRPGKLHEESVPGVDTNKFVYHVTRGHVLYSAASGARVFTGHKFLNRSLPELRKQAEQEFALAVAAVTPPGHSPAVNAAPSLAWITFLRTDGKDFKGAWEAGTLARLLYLHRNDKEAVTLSMPQDIADLEVSPEDDVRLATWTALAGRNLKQKEAGRVAEEGWRCGLKYKPYEMMTTLAGTEAVKCYLAVEDKKNAQRLLDEINKHEIDCPLHKVDNNSCVEVAQTNFQLGDPQMAVAVIKSGFDKLSKRQPVRTNDMQALAQLAAVYLASTNHAEADRWRKIADRLK